MPSNPVGGGSRTVFPLASVPLHWQHVRVLVADDHGAYRWLMGSLLDQLGVAHEAVGDGQQALQALARTHFDLVISDCRMPVMDGYAMTRELRRREQAAGSVCIPVLALAGGLGPEDIRRCLDCGMDGWLLKPITLEQLREVLLCWLSPCPHGPAAGGREPLPSAAQESFPSRASLIAIFGSWEVVVPMLASLIQEAREDLAVLSLARINLDGTLITQRLHRLVGSVAFLGAQGLELRAVQLIDQVLRSGVALNRQALEGFHQDVERYLQRLADL